MNGLRATLVGCSLSLLLGPAVHVLFGIMSAPSAG